MPLSRFVTPGAQLLSRPAPMLHPAPNRGLAHDAARQLAAVSVPTDEVLVKRLWEGDAWAKDALYRKYFGAVWSTALRLLQNRTEAEDVVQDSFATVLEEVHKLRDPTALRVWLLRITVHQVHRRFRKRRLRRWLGLDRGLDHVTLDQHARAGTSAEVSLELARLDRVLARLPASQRTAWILRHVEGYQLAEVALACRCSLATAKRRLSAAAAEVEKSVDFAEDDHG